MRICLARKARSSVLLLTSLAFGMGATTSAFSADQALPHLREFSGTIVKQVHGKKYHAQVFAKGDRLRLEYKYAIRTEHGYAAIEIIRLDQSETWYLLAQQKELLVVPLDPDDVLPMRAGLPGERDRMLVGDATAAGRTAQLYEVQTDRHGRAERFYEWVDKEAGIATGRSNMKGSGCPRSLRTTSMNRPATRNESAPLVQDSKDRMMMRNVSVGLGVSFVIGLFWLFVATGPAFAGGTATVPKPIQNLYDKNEFQQT